VTTGLYKKVATSAQKPRMKKCREFPALMVFSSRAANGFFFRTRKTIIKNQIHEYFRSL
jgi:hypothetical protein